MKAVVTLWHTATCLNLSTEYLVIFLLAFYEVEIWLEQREISEDTYSLFSEISFRFSPMDVDDFYKRRVSVEGQVTDALFYIDILSD